MAYCPTPRASRLRTVMACHVQQRWLGGSEQGVEWIVCLKAARMAAIRRDDEQKTEAGTVQPPKSGPCKVLVQHGNGRLI